MPKTRIFIDSGLRIEVRDDERGREYRLRDEKGSARFYPGEVALLIDALRQLNEPALFSGECVDTHAQPRPFSPEPHQKSEDAAIALEHGKEIRNGE